MQDLGAFIRRVTPRRLRQLVQHPVAECRVVLAAIEYRISGPATLEVSPGWTVRFHPVTRIAFAAHHSDPLYRDELRMFAETCTPGMTLIDVGAHYGVFTLAALHYGGPDAYVIAVDPSPNAQQYLALNLELNSMTGRVRRVATALGTSSEPLHVLPTGGGQAFQMVRSPQGRADATAIETQTVDAIARASNRRITHLKIDVEGFERQVLEGATMVLSEHRPFLTLELHNALLQHFGDSSVEVLALLRKRGYDGVCLNSDGQRVPMDDAATGYVNRLFLRPN